MAGLGTGLGVLLAIIRKPGKRSFGFFKGMTAGVIGALGVALFLKSFQVFVPGALAFAGGVMMFITLDELIPTAREHGHQHYTAVGIILSLIFVFLLSGIFRI